MGSGPLRAGETIIIDVFPRDLRTKYWGDMTRTVVKGRATDEVRRLHAAVREAHAAGVAAIAPGVTGDEVHRRVQAVFERSGFPTELRGGDWVGFFHGTGHGVGLDIHEPPRLSKNGPVLAEGMVITVEPGLYYPGVGGCRLEDLVVVTETGCRNLNRAPYDLEV
jgi:Xaa-Pro aminopeptidase